jgi:hypothetical protein
VPAWTFVITLIAIILTPFLKAAFDDVSFFHQPATSIALTPANGRSFHQSLTRAGSLARTATFALPPVWNACLQHEVGIRPMQRLLTFTAALILALSLSGCGGGSARSAEAYCKTVGKHRDRYLSAMDAATSSGGLSGLLGGIAAIGDIKNMWVDLAKVAPSEIQTDTEAVRDAWKASEDASLKGDYVGALAAALTNGAASERVNDYIVEKCGAAYAP